MPYSRVRLWSLTLTLACLCLLAACQVATDIQGAESKVTSQTSGFRVQFQRQPAQPFCSSTTVLPAPTQPQWRIKWTPPAK